MIDRLNSTLKTLTLLGIMLLAGWWTLFLRGKLNEHQDALDEKDRQIEESAEEIEGLERENAAQALRVTELGDEVERQAREIKELDAAMRLLKVDHRLARIEVLAMDDNAEGQTVTRLAFSEVDVDGNAIGERQELEILGKRVYVESLIIKFEDDYVEAGDFLRGTSVCLFRSVFGEDQKPSNGTPLEVEGRRPRVYAGDHAPDPFYDDLWDRFWTYANDPEAAEARGVRAMHGEAPFTEVEVGKSYLLELRASDGLTIRPE